MSPPDSFSRAAVVVTSISKPNAVLTALADGCQKAGGRFYVAGDTRSPEAFSIPGCTFLDIESQRRSGFRIAELCPERSYTRKNFAYLFAIRDGAQFIVETDDDNFPLPDFWSARRIEVFGHQIQGDGWINVYERFSDAFIYPRGFPLSHARKKLQDEMGDTKRLVQSLVQQGLANQNPDVDAIYRMLFPLPLDFLERPPVVLGVGQWCPFNSQNTTFFREAYPLLYLPAFCSFRMTDIWRSFVAQRILWECDANVSFHTATVYQERNEHDLMVDFFDEISGYLHNNAIKDVLNELSLQRGLPSIPNNLLMCYEAMVAHGWIDAQELKLLEAWLNDCRDCTA